MLTAALRDLADQGGGLYNLAGLAQALGISKQRASQIAAQPDFPRGVPINEQGSHRVWLLRDVEDWRKGRGR